MKEQANSKIGQYRKINRAVTIIFTNFILVSVEIFKIIIVKLYTATTHLEI